MFKIKKSDKSKQNIDMIEEKMLMCLFSADSYYNSEWAEKYDNVTDFKKLKSNIITESQNEINNIRKDIKEQNIQPMEAVNKVSSIYSKAYSDIVKIIDKEKNIEAFRIENLYCFAYLIRFADIFFENEKYIHKTSQTDKSFEQIQNSGRINNINKAFICKEYASVCHELWAIVNAYDIFSENVYNIIKNLLLDSLKEFHFNSKVS